MNLKPNMKFSRESVLKTFCFVFLFVVSLMVYNHFVIERSFSGIKNSILGFCFSPKVWCFSVFAFFILLFYQNNFIKTNEFLYKNRFAISFILFVILVLFEITGSSLGMWCYLFGEKDRDLLLGTSRPVRNDEWAVFTPLSFSQYYNGFGYFNDLSRAAPTDVFLEYGQAVKNPLVYYRPFFWGFLFLPVAKGMAFFWCGRLIALFMVSFEFSMMITEKKKLSVLFALMMAYAPIVQWWFAINGLAEMLIFMLLSVVVFKRYLIEPVFWKKCICLAVILMSAGGYALTFYPAWMVPLAYVLLALAVWVFVDNRKNCRMTLKDWISVALVVLIFAVSMAYFYIMSKETIQTLTNTVYPGKRFDNGGGTFPLFFVYITNLWHAVTNSGVYANVCESSYFIDFFPLSFVLPVFYIVKTKNKDVLTMLLLCVSLFLGLYCAVGFFPLLTKITMLGFTTPNRVVVAFGLSNLILLFRYFSKEDKLVLSKKTAGIIAFVVTLVSIFVCYRLNPEFLSKTVFRKIAFVVPFIAFVLINFCILFFEAKFKKLFAVVSLAVLFASSFLANPIRSGTKSVQNLSVIKTIQNISSKDPKGKWICEDGFVVANACLIAGAPCINSVNIYPYLERWNILDTSKEFEDVYNRYASILVHIKDVEEPVFYDERNTVDSFSIDLSVKHLRMLDVKYIMSDKDLSGLVEKNELKYITSDFVYNFYEVVD